MSRSGHAIPQNGFTSYVPIDAIDPLHRGSDLQLPHCRPHLSVSKNAALADQLAGHNSPTVETWNTSRLCHARC